MKRIILGFVSLFIVSSCALAQDNSNFWSKYSIYRNNIDTSQQPSQTTKSTTNTPSQYSNVRGEEEQYVEQKYGSIYSPSFLNRENIDGGPTNSGFSNF